MVTKLLKMVKNVIVDMMMTSAMINVVILDNFLIVIGSAILLLKDVHVELKLSAGALLSYTCYLCQIKIIIEIDKINNNCY